MKGLGRFNLFCVVLVLFNLLLSINVLAFSGSGQGTEASPYLITNKQQFNEIRNDLTAYYKLTSNIDLNNELWTSIGSSAAPFKGSLDGNGFSISNLKIEQATKDYQGIFRYADGTKLKNISIINVDIQANSYVGSLAGYIKNGLVENCSVTGEGLIKVNGRYVGGLIGMSDSNSINNSYSTINVEGISGEYGGLIGRHSGNISQSYATGTVSGSSNYLGGLIGLITDSQTTISECYASGNITTIGSYVGGLVGYAGTTTGEIKNSFALGNVTGNTRVGGLVGRSSVSILNCYSIGKITGSSETGLSGYNDTIVNSYYNSETSQVVPTKKTDMSKLTTEMKTKNTYVNWDFTSIWSIKEGTSYPYLKKLAKEKETGGTGTVEDPFIINTVEELKNIKTNLAAHYKLGSNIDLNNELWTPIGQGEPFTGTLDGNGFSISNLMINISNSQPCGLFGKTDGAKLKNIAIINVDTKWSFYKPYYQVYIGSLVGILRNTYIDNCFVKGNGGINASMTGYAIGGLIGYSEKSHISNSYAAINIVGTGKYEGTFYGGLIGGMYSGSVTKSYATGNVSGYNEVGGLVGRISGANPLISECYAICNVTAEDAGVSGLVGKSMIDTNSRGEIKNSFALGSVTARYGGGLIGTDGSSGTLEINSCYFAGKLNGYMRDFYFSNFKKTTTNSYYDGITSQAMTDNMYASRLTTEMKRKDTFENWDFADVWSIEEGHSYPYLKNLTKPKEVSEGLPVNDVASGKGTEEDPFIIITAEQFNNLRFNLTAHYKLGSNIDLKNELWTHIGLYENSSFKGTLDGNGFSISNLKINSKDLNYNGLFAYADGARLKNITLINVDILAPISTLGSLVGRIKNGYIENCFVKGNGGIKTESHAIVGGLIGYSENSHISNSYASINIVGTGKNGGGSYGGLLGKMYSGNVTKSYATGNVSGDNTSSIGGLVGKIEGANPLISECYATGNVTAVTYGAVGGLIGTIDATNPLISECYATGNVTAETYGGGLVGIPGYADGEIKNSFALGDVKVTGTNSYVGGLTGYLNPYVSNVTLKITYCYSAGKVNGYYRAGLVNGNKILTTNSYFDSTTTAITGPYTQARTTEQMKQKSTFVGWDMDNVWGISDGLTYPYLRNVEMPFSFRMQAPTALAYNELTFNSVIIEWSAVANATEYEIEYLDKIILSTTPSLKFTELKSNTEYKFRVRGKNGDVTGFWSDYILIKTKLMPLTKVEGLVCTTKATDSVTLGWNSVIDAAGYEIIYGDNIKTSTSNSITINSLFPNTTYTFQVRAYNSKEKGEASDPHVVKTNLYSPQTPYAVQFYEKCEEQWWLIDELESILNKQAKSINTITSRDDFANVYALGLANRNITGKIPKAIGELYNLEYLYLANNNLSENIPAELYSLTKLKNLDLSHNNLTGTVSESISSLTKLQVLLLHNNKLEGSIPKGICFLTSLRNLDLAYNKFSNSIPENLGNLSNLQFLSLSDNQLTGTLPTSFANLTNLQVLILSNNIITGSSLLDNYFKTTKIRLLDLSNNNLALGTNEALLQQLNNGEINNVTVVIK